MKYHYFILFALLFNCSENIKEAPDGMVWIPKGSFYQGAIENDTLALFHVFKLTSIIMRLSQLMGLFMAQLFLWPRVFMVFML